MTVVKRWVGDDYAGTRPESIRVQLLCNGVFSETVTLSEATGWTHTWDGLDANSTWTVDEIEIPEGYYAEITVSEDGTNVTIVNTYEVEVPDEPPPLTPGPDPEPPEPPEEPEIDIPEEPVPLANVPKTGDISLAWYPMLLLSGCGMAYLFLTKKREDDE